MQQFSFLSVFTLAAIMTTSSLAAPLPYSTAVGIGNGDHDLSATFRGASLPSVIAAQNRKRQSNVGILNGATGNYDFDGASFGPIIGSERVGRRDNNGDVGVKNGATGGGDYSDTQWGPQIGNVYIDEPASFTASKRDNNGDVGVKNGATGGGDYSDTQWGPQVGNIYVGEPDSFTASKRDGNNDADPCPGVPVGPSVGTTYMPLHPSTNNRKRCSETPIAPTDGGIVYTNNKRMENAEEKRDGNNDADPCPGVPVGPSVGTTYMPLHPSTNNRKRCSETPIAPTDGGIVYTNNKRDNELVYARDLA